MSIEATPDPHVEQPATFTFSAENAAKIPGIIAKFPAGKQQSATLPLLWLAQYQHGWLPTAAMDVVADMLNVPRIKVYETASFYTMFNRKPIGKHHIQVCTTTPCWLRGSDGIVKACKEKLGIGFGQTTTDGQFAMSEVECLGACCNAPMVQINDDVYEDLTPDSIISIIDALAAGKKPQTGSQQGRRGSEPKEVKVGA
ncbi:MAG: NADH-quinone oxidoreductase subunit NuoE [Bdellovibrionales bacterium]